MGAAAIGTRAASNVALHVGTPGPAVASEAAALLNESLGSGFTQPSALAQLSADGGGVLIRARGRGGGLLGAATARVLDPVRPTPYCRTACASPGSTPAWTAAGLGS